ncbi:peptidase M3, partial [Bacillus anthracis]|nr:peptidase M3 [Bacillus anthracis]
MFNDLESKLQSLLERNITSVLELENWLFDELRVNAEIEEKITSSLIATYRDTDNRNMRDLHMYNKNTIQQLLKR